MSGRIITADVAQAMAAKWKGYDGPYGVSWDDEGDCVIHYDDITIARVAHFDNGHTEALAHLFAVAPDDVKELSASVVAQAAEIERLRAIIDGRTTPPTDAEIAAHYASGGAWVHSDARGSYADSDEGETIACREEAEAEGLIRRWIPLADDGRPCAWPVVAEASR